MNRRDMLKRTAATVGVLPFVLSRSEQSQDDATLDAARARIEQVRKAGGTVVVRDDTGKPIPNVPVRIEQVRHEFLFGSNLFRLGRNRDDGVEASYRDRAAAILNYATLGFYWASYERERGHPQYAATEQAVAWCRGNGIACKGHPLVWDDPASVPKWLPADKGEAARLSLARVAECVRHFEGNVGIWDVVNEPTTLDRYHNPISEWANQVGAVEYTRQHLLAARSASPHAKLLVNDFNTDRRLTDLLRLVLANDPRLVDAIGIQSHMHNALWPLRKIWEVCDRFAPLGLPVHFTEITVVSGPRRGPGYSWGASTADGERAQADYVPRLYTMLFAHPAVSAATWWDLSDDGAWQGAPSGWLRADGSPKPVYDRVRDLVTSDWWTRVAGRTDAKGEFTLRAFRGIQRVSVTAPSRKSLVRDVLWTSGENRVEMLIGE